MPYRRLPKTDQARIKTLEKAIEMERWDIAQIPIPFKLLNEAKTRLPLFKSLVQQYNFTFEQQVEDNKKFQIFVRNARMYISHFIQVLNFTVIRGEIKKENKLFYRLEMDDHTVPDLSTETSLLILGKNIIEGEEERVRQGGIPLQFPNIAKVKVHYHIFKECKVNQHIRKGSTSRNWHNVVNMREKIDEIIKEIWDIVEAKYADMLPYERNMACKKCGVIYYYRRREARLTTKVDDDINRNIAATLTLDFQSTEEAE